jgi:hypothetical protein
LLQSLSAQAQGAHARSRDELPAPPLGPKACTLAELCGANPDAVLELAADRSLICMPPPTGGDTGARLGWLLITAERAVEIWAG